MIAVVDSGYGNLRSVEKAIAKAGGNPIVTGDPDVIRTADRIVVPGQGAFADCVRAFSERGLGDAIREVIAAGRPYLGICLGLQVLFDESEEHGPIPGLGLLGGRVVRFRPSPPADKRQPVEKVPHMGWNRVRRRHDAPEPLLAGIPEDAHFYFVHSYYVEPADPNLIDLSCDYAGVSFAAAVRKDNLFACQFHPEKSQSVGLRLLHNFATT